MRARIPGAALRWSGGLLLLALLTSAGCTPAKLPAVHPPTGAVRISEERGFDIWVSTAESELLYVLRPHDRHLSVVWWQLPRSLSWAQVVAYYSQQLGPDWKRDTRLSEPGHASRRMVWYRDAGPLRRPAAFALAYLDDASGIPTDRAVLVVAQSAATAANAPAEAGEAHSPAAGVPGSDLLTANVEVAMRQPPAAGARSLASLLSAAAAGHDPTIKAHVFEAAAQGLQDHRVTDARGAAQGMTAILDSDTTGVVRQLKLDERSGGSLITYVQAVFSENAAAGNKMAARMIARLQRGNDLSRGPLDYVDSTADDGHGNKVFINAENLGYFAGALWTGVSDGPLKEAVYQLTWPHAADGKAAELGADPWFGGPWATVIAANRD